MNTKPTLWLRAEHKPNEARAAVTPAVAGNLLKAGYPVVIEASSQRAIPTQNYVGVGCQLADAHSWRTDADPKDTIVIGLKELPVDFGPFCHSHIHFAHVYKQQQGWESFLMAFNRDGGTLYDLEYLVDDTGRRVAAFGYWAGYVGAALSVLAWCAQKNGGTLNALEPWKSKQQLVDELRSALQNLRDKPNALVIGALGRSGRGASDLFAECGLDATQWDQEETTTQGPYQAVLDHTIFINCVFLSESVGAFTHLEHLQNSNRCTSVICNVSCDPYSNYNPLPIYQDCTTMLKPSVRIIEPNRSPPLDLISIDHLPSLLPIESSEEFSESLAQHLLGLDNLSDGVWEKAAELFHQKTLAAKASTSS